MSWHRRPRSVRIRLTLAYVAAMLAVLAVYAGVVYVSVRGNLSQALDDKLRADFQWPKHMMTEEMVRAGNFEDVQEEGSPWLQVWTENGKLIHRFRTKVTPFSPEIISAIEAK